MSVPIFLLWLVSIPLIVHAAVSPPPLGFLLSCGASTETAQGSLKYMPDEGFVSVGNKSTVSQSGVLPILSTLRYFPDTSARKYCYTFPVIKGGKFLVRTTYYYGGFDGGKEPPVFDQIVDGTKWSIVNTKEDYANGLSSYYEIIVTAQVKTLSVCLARNEHTGTSSPFISAIELQSLEDSVYNSTDFGKYGLATIARNSFGYDGDTISFPDDQFNRFWQPFTDNNPVVACKSNATPSDFWSIPPSKALSTALTTSRGKTLTIKWPPFALPEGNYYVALYFQDNRSPSPYSWRVFSVTVNGKDFYNDINVTTNGVTVYTAQWLLSGQTEIVLTPKSDSPVGPVINAGEILQIFLSGRRTLTRDVIALEELARRFDNPPSDWYGDPCLPKENSWTGVMCSYQGRYARVISLNLTSVGIMGELSDTLDNLTALKSLFLGGNKLSGSIPQMGSLKALEILHLEGNQLEGPIPESLGQLPQLREVFLQNNELNGTMPSSLANKNGINLQVSPGNTLLQAATHLPEVVER
ncbi:LRR receptor-like serine/threonine-protein kinase precursor [Actinidia chinensis var. chinensis]|uniref:LRR receptor-like serine/threonine-protein kinase n=1 Tax=Actinidia chinensis var. chinensis TaxID=1590841 RepID=A0A2R6R1V5_ACTCC|nr:LRR receptor-like serine/threonine-protein kinase precursor [Actinidia chinensis var. chinensis]